MEQFVSVFNFIASILTVIGQAGIVIILGLFLFSRKNNEKLFQQLNHYALWLVLFISLGSVVASLIYSEIIGYPPCSLCWWERIFMYPEVLIAGVALIKKQKDVYSYILPLSIAGAVITVYHSYLQYGGSALISCSSYGLDCAQRFVFEFGYITIPLMAFTSFLLITLLFLLNFKNRQAEKFQEPIAQKENKNT